MVVISAEFDDSEVVERRAEIRLASRYTVLSYYYNQEEDRMNGRENRYELVEITVYYGLCNKYHGYTHEVSDISELESRCVISWVVAYA